MMIIKMNYEYENKDEDETVSQKLIKNLNDNLDKIIDKSKSVEEQIKSLKKRKNLKGPYVDYDDKELKSKLFKIQLADMSNEIDKKLFKTIFGHTLIKLADKEENQIIINDIHKNRDKLLEMDDFNDWVIQPNRQRINLIDTIKLILNFNEDQLYLV